LSDFSEIRFEPPGYPVYRAFIVPLRRGEEPCNVVEVGAQEVELWRKMLQKLKSFLSKAVESSFRGGRKLEDYERLELVGDLISLFLRAPLNREVLSGVAPSPLKAYAFMRLTGFGELFDEKKRLEFDLLKFTKTFYIFYSKCLKEPSESKWYSELAELLNELETIEVADLLESCWLLIPADTRPVLNTASLISHLLLTSAIAWSTAINEGIKDRRTLALLRLAALLHDIGKPFKYRKHVETSVEVAKELLRGLIPDEDVALIIKLIEEHHSETRRSELSEIVNKADHLASAIDRLRRLLDTENFRDIKDRLEEAAKALNYDSLNKAFDDWDFWRRAHEEYDKELLRDLSERFVEKVRKLTKNFTVLLPKDDKAKEEEAKEECRNLKIVLIDVGGIQSFIYRSHSLRLVAAASLVIDSLVMAFIPSYLQWALSKRCWLPYESFLYTAGGNVELLVPATLLADIEGEVSRLNESPAMKCKTSLRLHIANANLYEDYAKTIEELMAAMSIKKVCVAHQSYSTSTPKEAQKGARSICQLCFTKPPTGKVSVPEGELEACELCEELNEIGLTIHFKEKYESKISIRVGQGTRTYIPGDIFEVPWSEEGARVRALERIMELIAGHDREELQELGRLARIRNVALIKVDGSSIGSLMTTSLSISDAYERSARIDLALKKAIEVAVSEVYNGISKDFSDKEATRAALSIKIGLLYAGGDDALMLAPSWVSPLIALVLGKEFLYNLGRVRGLSIGVAVASSKANVWALIDASSELMNKAKKKIREKIGEGLVDSAVCFDVIETGDLSSSTINERFETLRHERLTSQPFSVSEFEEILSKLLAQGRGSGEGKFSYADIVRLSYLASRNLALFKASSKPELVKEARRIQEVLKKVRSAIGEVLQAARSMISRAGGVHQYSKYIFSIAYIYAYRQAARLKPERGLYEFVGSLIPDDLDSSSSLSDVDRLIKIIGGGII